MADGDAGSFRTALRHRDYRWLASAYVISNIGSWAYNVALMVWVFEATNSPAWAGAVTLARFVPALLFSAYGGVLAERFERRSLMVTLNLTSAATHILLAGVVAVDGPIVVALVLAATATLQGMVYEPAAVAITPQIVGERDLPAANALNSMIDNLAVVVGPAIGALLLIWFSPPVTLLVNAGTFVYAAFAFGMIGTRSRPTDVTEGGNRGPLAQMVVGLKALAESSTARWLAGFSVLASFFYGTDTVLYVVLSERSLGTGANGYGYLLAALGVGGVLAAPLVNRLATLPRLGTVLTAGMIVYTAPTAFMALVDEPVVAAILQVVRGAGTVVVDVLALTAIQRTLAPSLVSRVYGVFVGFVLAAISLGALITPPLVDGPGLTATLLIYGIGTPVLMALAYPRMLAVDRLAQQRLAELGPRISVLDTVPLFADLGRAGIERLAAAAGEVEAPAGEAVVRQGEASDALYVIAEGSASVTARDEEGFEHAVATLGPGDLFGEIGLLENAPRNATVITIEPSRLLHIDGDVFLSVASGGPGAGLQELARSRAGQTRSILSSPAGRLRRTGNP